ncbi:MAG TPA: GGDEF domain-containing protein [Frankiaceae bacterium]|nr:GGDEF domain-containing protein [Frankiaceae bacterium]
MTYGAEPESEAPANGLLDVTAAERRDEAATARDDAAVARDVVAAGPSDDQASNDRESAARDRADAARDREAWTVLATAGAARDAAAALRDAAAAGADDVRQAYDRGFAAADRAASAQDRQHAALDRHSAADHLQQAYRDDLTGLLLRDAGLDQLRGALDRARRLGEPIVVAFLDVDHLKAVNDQHGHAAGDDLLRAVGTALREGLRSYDVVLRYGGDEFLCAFVGARPADAEHRLEAVGAALSSASAGASFSFGLAELAGEASIDGLVALADGDMYARRAVQRA